MSSADWLVLVCAGASAGVYAGTIAAMLAGRRRITGLPFSEILTGLVFFVAERAFPNAAALTILAALFLAMASVQIVRARQTPPGAKILALVPVIAMLLVTAGQLAPQDAIGRFEIVIAVLLCLPAPAAASFKLWDLYLIRKIAFDRVA